MGLDIKSTQFISYYIFFIRFLIKQIPLTLHNKADIKGKGKKELWFLQLIIKRQF